MEERLATLPCALVATFEKNGELLWSPDPILHGLPGNVAVEFQSGQSVSDYSESFLQFCISHEIEIHFEWDLKSLSLSQLLEAVGESACL